MKFIATSVTVLFLLFAAVAVHGEPAAPEDMCTSNSAGDWSVAGRWDCGHVPTSADEVVINHAVTLDTDATILSLTINNTLMFDNSANYILTVSGNVTINNGGTIGINKNATHTLNIGGDFTNNGTFAGYQNGNRYIDLTFNGTRQQTISGSGTPAMRNLQVNSGSSVIFPATNLPAVNGTMTVNAGGAVQQTQTVNNGTVNFLQISTSAYRGVDLITTNNLGSTTVVITTTVNGGCTTTGTGSPAYATRCYSIMPANDAAATVRLYALTTSQLNGIAQANLRIYRYTSGWQQLTTNTSTGSASGGYSYAQADTPGFSAFLLGGATGPTAVTLSTLTAQAPATTWTPPIGLLLALGAVLLLIRRRAR